MRGVREDSACLKKNELPKPTALHLLFFLEGLPVKAAAPEDRRLGTALKALKCFEIESEVAGVLRFKRREDVLICWPTLVRVEVAIGRERICANIPLS